MIVVLMEVWSHGGTAQYVAELTSGLRETGSAGDEVHLLVPRSFDVSSFADAASGAVLYLHPVLPELRGLGFGGKIGGALGLSWNRWRQIARAARIIREIRPAAVHIFSISAVSGGLLRQIRRARAKSVVTVHDLPQRGGGLSQAFYRAWSRHFTQADRLIVHGPWSRSQIEARLGRNAAQRTEIMPLGLYNYGSPSATRAELRARFGLPKNSLVLIFFGSLRRNKGLENIIEALAQSRTRQIHLLVAGQRPSQSEPAVQWYQNLAQTLGVAGQITWIIRFIENHEVPDLFAASDVAVLPYDRSFAAQSSVLSVAAAYDVPVIASDVGDIGATVREYCLGVCIEPESRAAWANALRDLEAGTLDWGTRGADDFAHDASWENIGRRLWALYRDLAFQKGERKTV